MANSTSAPLMRNPVSGLDVPLTVNFCPTCQVDGTAWAFTKADRVTRRQGATR